MKKIIVIAYILLLTGCSSLSMSNNKIIQETKKCRDANMHPAVVTGGVGNIIIKCIPIEEVDNPN